jgi:hypothetical protein
MASLLAAPCLISRRHRSPRVRSIAQARGAHAAVGGRSHFGSSMSLVATWRTSSRRRPRLLQQSAYQSSAIKHKRTRGKGRFSPWEHEYNLEAVSVGSRLRTVPLRSPGRSRRALLAMGG